MARVQKIGLSAKEIELGVQGYLFVDLDAGKVLPSYPGISASNIACDKLTRVGAIKKTELLDCGENTLTNRQLLANVVAKSYGFGAKVVVIDVELTSQPNGVLASGNEMLKDVLKKNESIPTFSVVAADPQPVDSDESTLTTRAKL
ncbi:hypothetical protein Q9L58_010924 [Maublancomyces gigas]|uniref:Uncharacterized protein n=1 Tax=Discina gigas TaxID=1032678 RepID=A0ABR3G2S2_9PEZI